ncbi:alpha/beta hydrolase [Rhodobacteraceae bacterium F11138]|nr:alpha/beta hydrolase [Rhodobacteraceae bacterium F11138]
MTLDPALSAMLDRARSAGGPALNDLPLAEARTALREMFLAQGYPVRHPAKVTHHSAVECGGTFDLHIYRPEAAQGPLPGIIYFHGGGFVLGDAAAYDTHSRALAHLLGAAVIVVGYRLAPEHRFPAAITDASAAMDYLSTRLATLDVQADRIVIMGESAGGNLAVNAAIHAARTGGLCPRGLCLIYPVTDTRPFTGYDVTYPSLERFGSGTNLDRAEMDWFCDTYLNDRSEGARPENTLLLHPELHLLPKTRIYVGECDPLRDMGIAFAMRLLENGVDARSDCLPGMMHSFMCQGAVSARALRHFFRIVEEMDGLLGACCTGPAVGEVS